MNEDTGFKDKTGKPIQTGDVVQIIAPGKTGGASRSTVLRKGKYFITAHPNHYGSDTEIRIDDHRAKLMVIVDHIE